MLTFSRDPQTAEKQMQAILFSLVSFGHIDGDFDERERQFVKDYLRKLVIHRVKTGMPDADPKVQIDLVERFATHFLEVFDGIDRWVTEVMNEPVSKDDSRDAMVHGKLKLRCFELFKQFDRPAQEALLETIDEFIVADGHMHPAETKFRSELSGLLAADAEELDISLLEDEDETRRLAPRMTAPVDLPTERTNHVFFNQFEHHYSRDPSRIQEQIQADLDLMDRVHAELERQRQAGEGRLRGHQQVTEFSGPMFLDGHVYVLPRAPNRRYELLVLGDLHGCYSCLKGAVLQSGFFDKVAAFRKDPAANPEPHLILLGDYIDRGIFSLNGVLRTAMQLFVTAPELVHVLRGNHEYYVEVKGNVYGGVKPAESINTLKPHLPIEVFRKYMALFEALPNVLFFDRTMFVHAGVPRDRALKERYRDLSSLNDPDLRFQMMWSDPSIADVIPSALQEQSARFPFGRLQLQAFLSRVGCNLLVRGHEKVDSGFERVYDDARGSLVTLFSAGGQDNADLPEGSSYRSVTPKALLIVGDADGSTELRPFDIDWRSFNDPANNAFFRNPMQIEHRVG